MSIQPLPDSSHRPAPFRVISLASPSSSSSPLPEPSSKPPSKRRTRPKINLAPGQPPTVRGNDRIRVYVACYQCRARKIRCDGAKPICLQCQQRRAGPQGTPCEPCSYNTAGPKRRGREKGKGSARSQTLATSSKGTKAHDRTQSDFSVEAYEPLRLPTDDTMQTDSSPGANTDVRALYYDPLLDYGVPDFPDEMSYGTAPSMNVLIDIPQFPVEPSIVVTPPERDLPEEEQDSIIPSRPGTQFARDTWWDALLTSYATDFTPPDELQAVSLTHGQRNAAMKLVVADLRALLQTLPCYLGFFNLPRFFDTLFDPTRRNSLQPSFLLSALALGKLAKSSEVEEGARGRAKASSLLQMAHGALEGSLATGWIDIGLAYASLLIVYFEMHTHPQQSTERTHSALLLLDSLMRVFSLTSIDETIKPRGRSPYSATRSVVIDPTATPNFVTPTSAYYGLQSRPSYYSHRDEDINFAPQAGPNTYPVPAFSDHSPHLQPRGCNCVQMTLAHQWPAVKTIAPSWAGSVMWPEGLTEGDFRREECRRFVWSCVMTIAVMNAFTSVPGGPDTGASFSLGPLIVREPENFALLLPGEALALAGARGDADDVFKLNLRTMLLVHLVMRSREDLRLSPAKRAQMAIHAWLEVDEIEGRMARHTCDLESTFGYEASEMLFLLRMFTSYEFQQFIPQITTNDNRLFYRDKAESWLRKVDEKGDFIWNSVSIGTLSSSQDHRRSLLAIWIVYSIRRALALWKGDNSLTFALTMSCKFADRVELGLMLWPNQRLREGWQKLRYLLVEACLISGVPPPSAALPRLPTGKHSASTLPSEIS